MCGREVSPVQIARILRLASVRHVIIGTHAVNAYSGRPRATADVDVIVAHPHKAAAAIAQRFVKLTRIDSPEMIRFTDGKLEAVDLLIPVRPVHRRLLKEIRTVGIGGERLHLPTLEATLASRFDAMRLTNRRYPEQYQDAADFMRIVDANDDINLKLLAQLGEIAIPRGGGDDIVRCVEDSRAKRRLKL